MTTTTFRKNRLFAKYGHECEMANELDELPLFVPGNGICARISRALIRLRMVSEISRHSNQYFRSQGAIANEQHRHLHNYFHIIHPFSDARKWWEFFICIVFLIQFIVIPLDIAYFRIPDITLYQHKLWKWARLILDCLCFIDVWLNFATGYYNFQTHQAILNPKTIAVYVQHFDYQSHYLSTYFLPDFISSLPTNVDLLVPMESFTNIYIILQVTSVLKMLRLRTFVKYCSDFSEIFDIPYAVHKVVMLIIISIIFFHFVTCSLIFLHAIDCGYFSIFTGKNERIGNKSLGSSFVLDGSYTGAFYCATILIGNAGYGNTPPDTTKKVLLIVVIWLISRLLLILVIGRIVQIIKVTTSANHKYIEMVRQLREYMRHKRLPEYMQRRLLTYYEFRFQKSYFRESEILSTISGQLRQEIVMHSCRKLVENVAFFKNLPLTLLVRIVSCLRSEVFLVNDVIVRAATPGNSMFFIASGTVAVITSSGREICHLEDGSHFGEIALVMRDELRVASVVAVEVCELYRLDRKEFVRAIHPYPDLLDNIQRIAADRMERTTMLDEHNRREMASKRLY